MIGPKGSSPTRFLGMSPKSLITTLSVDGSSLATFSGPTRYFLVKHMSYTRGKLGLAMITVGLVALVIKKSKPFAKHVGEGFVKLGEEIKKCAEETPVAPDHVGDAEHCAPAPASQAEAEHITEAKEDHSETGESEADEPTSAESTVEPAKKETKPRSKKAAKKSA